MGAQMVFESDTRTEIESAHGARDVCIHREGIDELTCTLLFGIDLGNKINDDDGLEIKGNLHNYINLLNNYRTTPSSTRKRPIILRLLHKQKPQHFFTYFQKLQTNTKTLIILSTYPNIVPATLLQIKTAPIVIIWLKYFNYFNAPPQSFCQPS